MKSARQPLRVTEEWGPQTQIWNVQIKSETGKLVCVAPADDFYPATRKLTTTSRLEAVHRVRCVL